MVAAGASVAAMRLWVAIIATLIVALVVPIAAAHVERCDKGPSASLALSAARST